MTVRSKTHIDGDDNDEDNTHDWQQVVQVIGHIGQVRRRLVDIWLGNVIVTVNNGALGIAIVG